MGDIFEALRTETITLEKEDGSQYPNIKADHKPGLFSIYAGAVPSGIADGDFILHHLPHNQTERYEVIGHGYNTGVHGVSQYDCKVRKASAPPPLQPVQIIYNVTMTGPNSRFNLESLDLSSNLVTVKSADELFEKLKDELRKLQDGSRVASLLVAVDAMEQNRGTPKFVESYKAFMSMAADYMTLLAPFLPSLALLLS